MNLDKIKTNKEKQLNILLGKTFIKLQNWYVFVGQKLVEFVERVPSQNVDKQTLDTTNPRQANARHDNPRHD